jgi:hypothetical protein
LRHVSPRILREGEAFSKSVGGSPIHIDFHALNLLKAEAYASFRAAKEVDTSRNRAHGALEICGADYAHPSI